MLKTGSKTYVRSDIGIGTAVDETQIIFTETHNNLAGQMVTISGSFQGKDKKGDAFYIYQVKEDPISEGRSENFFTDVSPKQELDPFSDTIDAQKTIISQNEPDKIADIMVAMKDRQKEYSGKIKDNDILRELFFSKLEDTLKIYFSSLL